jgi:AraC family transcriptional regulator
MWLHETLLNAGQALVFAKPPSPRLPQTQIALLTADASVRFEPNALVLVLALAGRCVVDSAEGRTLLMPRHFQVCDVSEAVQVQLHQRGLIVAFSFSAAALRRLDALESFKPLPGVGRLDAVTTRLLCTALREAQAPTASFWLREPSIRSLLRHVARAQVELRERLAACPGKSQWRKTQVMLRLQRARRFLDANCDRIVRIADLAEMTNFSHWYFTKTFHRVYGESPKSYATRVRLERAQHLLCRTDSAVGDVAAACGFESHSAFSRAFRQRFGVSAIHSRAASIQPNFAHAHAKNSKAIAQISA